MGEPAKNRGAVLAILMLLLGLAAIEAGGQGVKQWDAVAQATRIYYGVSLLAGLALVASAAWLGFTRRASRGAIWAGSSAALTLGINQAAGMSLGTIPCYAAG